ncbi:MAG: sensor histidine kinase [Planctomycetota bacterium]
MSISHPEVAAPPSGPFSSYAPVLAPASPDAGKLHAFLQELRLPLAASQGMLSLLDDSSPSDSVRMALQALQNHNDYLVELVSEYALLNRLAADEVQVVSQQIELQQWLNRVIVEQGRLAETMSIDLSTYPESQLPETVLGDPELMRRALAAMLQVAMHRTIPASGRSTSMDLRVRWQTAYQADCAPRLVFELVCRDEMFESSELPHIFAPFRVRDSASRPLLGLCIAKAAAERLGGSLEVETSATQTCLELSFQVRRMPQAVFE